MKIDIQDNRPNPKPRKNPQLWQAFLIWDELVQMRKRHLLRLKSIEAGKSNLDSDVEKVFLDDIGIDELIDKYLKEMIAWGEASGVIWEWVTSIRGLKQGSLAAQLLAQIDDISKFVTISKLWAYSGYAVRDGRREYLVPGKKAGYNKRLKSTVYLVVDQFVKHRTPVYREIYDNEKDRLRILHPERVVVNDSVRFNDGHINAMAMRKTGKIFLQHLWLIWRQTEGLPISKPYVHDKLGHDNIVLPEAVRGV